MLVGIALLPWVIPDDEAEAPQRSYGYRWVQPGMFAHLAAMERAGLGNVTFHPFFTQEEHCVPLPDVLATCLAGLTLRGSDGHRLQVAQKPPGELTVSASWGLGGNRTEALQHLVGLLWPGEGDGNLEALAPLLTRTDERGSERAASVAVPAGNASILRVMQDDGALAVGNLSHDTNACGLQFSYLGWPAEGGGRWSATLHHGAYLLHGANDTFVASTGLDLTVYKGPEHDGCVSRGWRPPADPAALLAPIGFKPWTSHGMG